jgi:hypothetical protein
MTRTGKSNEMPTANLWRVTIKRLDGSTDRYSEPHAGQPRRGEIVERVIDGRLVKAEINSHHLAEIRVGKLATWTVEAEET